MTNASARPATTELIKKTSTDAVVVFPSELLGLGRFIVVMSFQFGLHVDFQGKPVYLEVILSANRLSRMSRFGKITDYFT